MSTLAVAGDLVPTRPFLPPAHGCAGSIFDLVRAADLGFCDLEVPLTQRGAPWSKLVVYRGAPELARAVREAGFSVVSLANNQILNYGAAGLLDTIDALAAAGVRHVGAGPSLEAALAPVDVALDGATVRFLAFTCVGPPGWRAERDRPGVAAVRVRSAYEVDAAWESEEPGLPPRVRTWVDPDDLDAVTRSVRAASEGADLTVVSVHWGAGVVPERLEYQRPLGHALVDAGAGLVLGNHPPTPQGLELYRGRLIVYSQGMLVRQQPQGGPDPRLAGMYRAMPRESCLLLFRLSGGHVVEAEAIPAQLGDDQVSVRADGESARGILDRLLERSLGLDGRTAASGHGVRIDLAAAPALSGAVA